MAYWGPKFYADKRERIDIVVSDIGNSYGCATVWRTNDGLCWFGVKDHTGIYGGEVSEEFYNAFVKMSSEIEL